MCIGGSLGYWKHLRDVVTYDVEANAWTIEEDLPYPQRYMICVKTVIRNKEVVLCLFGYAICHPEEIEGTLGERGRTHKRQRTHG